MMKKLITIILLSFIMIFEAIGQVNYSGTTLSGINPSAIGTNTKAEGHSTFAAGFASRAIASYTTAFGFYSFATYTGAISIGSTVKANAENSIVLGTGGPWNENIFLENNMPRSLMIGFGSTKPTFYVSDSPFIGGLYNKTGKVAIGNVVNENGTMDPQAKLHIRADMGEPAAIFIEPNKWDNFAQANLFIGNMNHGITSDGSFGMIFHTQSAYIFNEGNVGIGMTEGLPETKLDVVGTVRVTGLRLQNQSVQPGFVLTCAGLNGEAVWQNPAEYNVWSLNEEDEAYRISNVGIGIENPKEKLEVAGNIIVNDAIVGRIDSKSGWYDSDFLTLKGSEDENAAKIMLCKGLCGEQNPLKIINPIGEIQFSAFGKIMFNIRETEAVFGRPDTEDYALKINGKVWSHEVEVRVSDWWDEVFDMDYELMPLLQLEKYIEANNHLPDMPTEENVLKNGIELGEMNALLLKKVEELTLYIIEQQKRLDKLENQLNK